MSSYYHKQNLFLERLQAEIQPPVSTRPLNDSRPGSDSSSLVGVTSSTKAIGSVAALSAV